MMGGERVQIGGRTGHTTWHCVGYSTKNQRFCVRRFWTSDSLIREGTTLNKFTDSNTRSNNFRIERKIISKYKSAIDVGVWTKRQCERHLTSTTRRSNKGNHQSDDSFFHYRRTWTPVQSTWRTSAKTIISKNNCTGNGTRTARCSGCRLTATPRPPNKYSQINFRTVQYPTKKR